MMKKFYGVSLVALTMGMTGSAMAADATVKVSAKVEGTTIVNHIMDFDFNEINASTDAKDLTGTEKLVYNSNIKTKFTVSLISGSKAEIGASGVSTKISYKVSVGGVDFFDANGDAISATSLDGSVGVAQELPVEITLNQASVARALPGDYEGSLTISVSAY